MPNDHGSRAETFKWFVDTCPAIKSSIWTKRMLSVPSIPEVTVPNYVTNEAKLCQGAWQSNAFYVRQLHSVAEIDSTISKDTAVDQLIAGRNERKFWHTVRTNLYTWTETPTEPRQAVWATARSQELGMTTALHLGIYDLQPGSLKWEGNDFTAFNGDKSEIYGTLITSNGTPQTLTTRFRRTDTVSFICEYQYGTNAPANTLPSIIRWFKISHGNKEALQEIILISMELAEEELPLSYFGPERFFDPQYEQKFIRTESLVLPANGLLPVIARPAAISSVPQVNRKPFMFMLIAFILMVPLSGLLWFRHRRRQIH